MTRVLSLLLLACACSAHSASEKFPFTPRAFVEPLVNCATDSDCGNGFCRKSVCLCDYNWATRDASEPCAYRRYSKVSALLLQIFLGWLAVGTSVLHWNLAVGLHWFFLILFSCSVGLVQAYSESDDSPVKALCTCCVAFLSAIGLAGTYICTIAFIAGNECMDKHGIACGV